MFRLIQNADVYAPEHLGKMDILLCNDRIVQMGENLACPFPDTEVIDATGKMAIPGLIDQHVHITGGGGESGFTTKVTEIGLSDCVRGGVTTICGVLGTDSLSRNVESVLAKAKALDEDGITTYIYTGSYDYPSPTVTGSVGKDIAFIKEVIGVKICISDHRYAGITKEELTKLAAAARVSGLIGHKPGVTHMHMGRGKDGLDTVFQILEETDIPIKNFRPTHASNNIPAMKKFADMGGYVDFTSGDMPDKTAQIMAEFLKDAPLELVTLSSDSNGSMPIWNEKNELIGIGAGKITTLFEVVRHLALTYNYPFSDALRTITTNVATALNFTRKGRLAVDCDADVVLLDSDYNIDTVIGRGRMMMKDKEVLVKGYFEK